MFWFIAGILVILFAVIGFFVAEGGGKVLAVLAGVIIGGGLIFTSTFYTQDVGEAKVLKNFDGTIVGQDLTPGMGNKAPWVSTENFNIRNQEAIHSNNAGDRANGPQITTQDKNGVTADYDVAVRYSIKPDLVTDIYTEYRTQEEFEARLIDQDIRAVVRTVPNNFTTIEALTKRGDIEKQIFESLSARWENQGVQVESVALQEIRYPGEVQQRFQDAQNASTEQERAKIELETTKITAEKRVVEANAEAEANRVLNESLTPEILQQRQLDTMTKLGEKGNVFVVPNGSSPLIQVDKK